MYVHDVFIRERTWGERRAGVGGESRGCAGAGVLKFADGEVYDGKWKDDKKNGRGTRGLGRLGGVVCMLAGLGLGTGQCVCGQRRV